MRGEVTPEQSRRVFVQRSWDDGRHFSAPRDITAEVKPPTGGGTRRGPGHAVALTRGRHAGRLVVPANHSAAPPAGSTDTGQEAKYYGAHAIYSDDGGRTWRHRVRRRHPRRARQRQRVHRRRNSPTAALYFSSRDQNGTSVGNRLDTYSSDGGGTLDRPYAVQPTLDDVPVVEGSVLQLGGMDAPLLFSGPSVPTSRRAMAVWRSTDAGVSFTKALTLSEQPAAYSDLAQVGRHTVGILYETGATGTYDTIEFRRVPVTDVSWTARSGGSAPGPPLPRRRRGGFRAEGWIQSKPAAARYLPTRCTSSGDSGTWGSAVAGQPMMPRRCSAALNAPEGRRAAAHPRRRRRRRPARTRRTAAPVRHAPAPSRRPGRARRGGRSRAGRRWRGPGTAPSAPSASAASTTSSDPVSTLNPVMSGRARAPVTTARNAPRSPLESFRPASTPSAARSRTSVRGQLGVDGGRDVVGHHRHRRRGRDQPEVAGDLGGVGARVEGRGHHDRVRARAPSPPPHGPAPAASSCRSPRPAPGAGPRHEPTTASTTSLRCPSVRYAASDDEPSTNSPCTPPSTRWSTSRAASGRPPRGPVSGACRRAGRHRSAGRGRS